MKTKFSYPVAIIDVGSNSVRLMIASEIGKQKYTLTSRLAEGMINNRLATTSILRTANAVALFFDLALSKRCKSVFIFATAAVRNSDNGDLFCAKVKGMTGLDVHVVSGELEAELALLGALNGKDGKVVDIGGASTEVAFKENGEIVYFESYKVGAVHLKDLYGRDKNSIVFNLQNTFKAPRRTYSGDVFAVGGTVSTLASMLLKLEKFESEKVHGYFISKQALACLVDELFELSFEEISQKYPTAKPRADVISGGAQILYELLNCYNFNGVYVSESDNLEGYLEYLKNEEAKD